MMQIDRLMVPKRLRRAARELISPRGKPPTPLSREFKRLQSLPRYYPTEVRLRDEISVRMPDAFSFLEMHWDIFDREIYKFRSSSPEPVIIDGGANIGLTILYFKENFPECRIVGFEADAGIFEYLEKNVRAWGFDKVELIRKALSDSDENIRFHAEGSYAGRAARPGDTSKVVVPATSLRAWLQRPVDLLKLNIEGGETAVIRDCADLLANVKNVAVEYHSFVGEPQTLPELLEILQCAGFRLHVNPVGTVNDHPLFARSPTKQMDHQLLLYGYRC